MLRRIKVNISLKIFSLKHISVSAIRKTLALFQKSLVSENEHSDTTVDKDLKGKKEGKLFLYFSLLALHLKQGLDRFSAYYRTSLGLDES